MSQIFQEVFKKYFSITINGNGKIFFYVPNFQNLSFFQKKDKLTIIKIFV